MAIYEDDAPHVVGAVITLLLLAVVTFGLRLYVRLGKTWGFEDTVMAIATVSISRTDRRVMFDHLILVASYPSAFSLYLAFSAGSTASESTLPV